ncbi:Uncharacterised protein [Mycobacteroides abscessus subsp. massiliense]|nr:hypothetical protein [Mycobacteroides abscessus]SKQ92181.1 Uncharacterised protein [Mycobacteroides abscessus subsp. massiliense]SKR36246.1 Uncharacterised protein [Mycobacteroides abscessus subsp. massiliense]SKT85177.1 Uncharacterised protein [Mycobacteroides abscessus subsp. massiliense]SKU14202.1 Uncharacterised protein [Mycobacteroides abscessus subsp. massiliense]SLA37510.1 Uncharacterised protein [Mycobacteroides abscessus subsp. massiliense]
MTLQANVQMLCESGGHIESALVDLVEPTNDLVQLRITASGVCHSDLHVPQANGMRRCPLFWATKGPAWWSRSAPLYGPLRPVTVSRCPGWRSMLAASSAALAADGCAPQPKRSIIAYPTSGQQ